MNQLDWRRTYSIAPNLQEDRLWQEDIQPRLKHLPESVQNIWNYGFTEMVNNAVDHSRGQQLTVSLFNQRENTRIVIADDGIGIFPALREALDLYDETEAVLELVKGKLTTAPDRHSGEGIFFTCRMFDWFSLCAGSTCLIAAEEGQYWDVQAQSPVGGTVVELTLNNHTGRTAKSVFDQYVVDQANYDFDRTQIPIRLAQPNGGMLITRSQAKRLIARTDSFRVVVLDFAGVEGIGQAFADEVFRVFANAHKEVAIEVINANNEVMKMIRRTKGKAV